MKALVKHDGPGLRLEEVAQPVPGPDDVLIRVDIAGICGSDLHIYRWDDWARGAVEPPLVIGHEFAGHIAEIGSNVSGFEVGDFVSAEGHVVCGGCRNCLGGLRHLCQSPQGIGISLPGGFAEYVVVPKTNVWRHDPGLDPEVAAISDPFGNAVHTALTYPVLGEDVLITGAGPIGLMAAAVTRHAGARHVVITEPNAVRRELALRVGVDRAVDPTTSSLAEVRDELGMLEGFDVALEMSGSRSAFEDILDNVLHGGRVALLGLPTEPFPIDWSRVILNMLTIKGIYGRQMFETWYKMRVLIESGLDITPVITHRFPIEDFDEAFATTASAHSGKVLLRIGTD